MDSASALYGCVTNDCVSVLTDAHCRPQAWLSGSLAQVSEARSGGVGRAACSSGGSTGEEFTSKVTSVLTRIRFLVAA